MESINPSELRRTVGHELARTGMRLPFSKALEDRFETDTKAARARHLIRSGVVTMILTNIFLVPDRWLVPDIFWLAAVLHGSFSLSYSGIILITARQISPRLREAMHAIFVNAAILGSISLLLLSHAPDRGYLSLTFSLYIVYVNVVTRLRFGWALTFSLSSIAAEVAAVLLSTGLRPGIQDIAILTIVTAAVLTLYANYFIEAGERRAFLLTLDQRLAAQELADYNTRLSELSTTDWLTGAANRRGLELHLAKCWDEAALAAQPIALLMIDVDHFKLYNDRHGHPAGDGCLTMLAALISQQLRLENDRLARYGGEEFAVVLPNTSLADAATVAERIRQAVEDISIPHGAGGAGAVVTVSIGAQSAQPARGGSPEQLISTADAALYQSKQAGRNRVCPVPVMVQVEKKDVLF